MLFISAITLLLHLTRPYFGDSRVFLSSIDIISNNFNWFVVDLRFQNCCAGAGQQRKGVQTSSLCSYGISNISIRFGLRGSKPNHLKNLKPKPNRTTKPFNRNSLVTIQTIKPLKLRFRGSVFNVSQNSNI